VLTIANAGRDLRLNTHGEAQSNIFVVLLSIHWLRVGYNVEELDGLAVCALSVRLRKLSNVLNGQSGMGDQKLLSLAPACFGRHVKPLVPAVFAVVSTHQPALVPRGGLWPVLLVRNP
jgi:hypothetical protein